MSDGMPSFLCQVEGFFNAVLDTGRSDPVDVAGDIEPEGERREIHPVGETPPPLLGKDGSFGNTIEIASCSLDGVIICDRCPGCTPG